MILNRQGAKNAKFLLLKTFFLGDLGVLAVNLFFS
jgi:hypothetical protein